MWWKTPNRTGQKFWTEVQRTSEGTNTPWIWYQTTKDHITSVDNISIVVREGQNHARTLKESNAYGSTILLLTETLVNITCQRYIGACSVYHPRTEFQGLNLNLMDVLEHECNIQCVKVLVYLANSALWGGRTKTLPGLWKSPLHRGHQTYSLTETLVNITCNRYVGSCSVYHPKTEFQGIKLNQNWVSGPTGTQNRQNQQGNWLRGQDRHFF